MKFGRRAGTRRVSIPVFLAVLSSRTLFPGTALQADSSAPSSEPGTAAPQCGYAPGTTIQVHRSVLLPPGCVLRKVRFVIAASDVTLDCNHAVLHGLRRRDEANPHGQPYPEDDTPADAAFLITNREDEPPLHHVVIKNCTVKNYQDGADVALQLNAPTKRMLRETKDAPPIEERLRRRAPHDITFERLRIEYAHKSGLYINRYASRVAFRDGSVTHSGNAAIYLNSGTTRNEISGSLFVGNGYYDYSPTRRLRSPKRKDAYREAIAVDSSSRNEIRGNRFAHNAAGGVFLYKNCWEHWTEPDQMPRTMHSSDNRIEGNHFTDEKVGVWIASRQARDLAGFDCGDPAVYEEGFWFRAARYYRDYAERATVRRNRFENVIDGIRVEDDEARLLENVFLGTARHDIVIGSPIRGSKLGIGVRGTQVIGNRFRRGAPCPIRILNGASNELSSDIPSRPHCSGSD